MSDRVRSPVKKVVKVPGIDGNIKVHADISYECMPESASKFSEQSHPRNHASHAVNAKASRLSMTGEGRSRRALESSRRLRGIIRGSTLLLRSHCLVPQRDVCLVSSI